jgi:hypothetical protein
MEEFKKQESLKPFFKNSYGFAFFGTVAKAGMGIGAGCGQGDIYIINKATGVEELVGHSSMGQISVGFQFGGQVYSEIIFFETERDFKHFASDNFEFGADANVVALTASAQASVSTMGNQGITTGLTSNEAIIPENVHSYTKGMAVFTITLGGLMYEATIKGQRFKYTPTAVSPPSAISEAATVAM